MTDLDALFRAVLEHPREDTPRLVLADHLDELGETDRAEFIRLQCKLAAMPGVPSFVVGTLVEYVRQEPLRSVRDVAGMGPMRHYEAPPEEVVIDALPETLPPGNPTGLVIDTNISADGSPYSLTVQGGVVIEREYPHRLRIRMAAGQDGYPGDRAELDRLQKRELELYKIGYGRWFDAHHPAEQYPALYPNWVDRRVRRGFVAELNTPIAALLNDNAFSGRIAPVAARHPIEHVCLTDIAPCPLTGDVYYWSDRPLRLAHGTLNLGRIPGELYELLDGHMLAPPPTDGPTTGCRFYRTHHEAVAAISRAAVRFLRRQAGLREVFPPTEPPT